LPEAKSSDDGVRSPALRVEALEKPLRRARRTHLIWWDEEEEIESDVRLRVERMIAQGKAHPDDRFFYVSWRH
jgi:hypothetical protein